MPTSDEDVQKKADKVQALREKVANAETVVVDRERELSNEITMKQLEAEEARLEARLTAAKAAGKVSTVKAGMEAPLAAVSEQMEQAVAAQKAADSAAESPRPNVETPTDTNTGGDQTTTKES